MGDFKTDNQEGLEFQDFVLTYLWNNGIPIYYNHSRKFQLRRGEGPILEVKLDRRSSETGNYYFECFHSPNGQETGYIESGVLGNGPIFWAQGDFREFFLFARKHLARHFDEKNPRLVDCRHAGDVPTRGFILPISEVEKLAIERFALPPDEPDGF